jgi:hypothetical protein
VRGQGGRVKYVFLGLWQQLCRQADLSVGDLDPLVMVVVRKGQFAIEFGLMDMLNYCGLQLFMSFNTEWEVEAKTV